MMSFIQDELAAVELSPNTLNEGALELMVRSVQGNLRLCRNLGYGALVETCRHGQRQVGIQQVNDVLIQPHWRSHDEVIRAKVT